MHTLVTLQFSIHPGSDINPNSFRFMQYMKYNKFSNLIPAFNTQFTNLLLSAGTISVLYNTLDEHLNLGFNIRFPQFFWTKTEPIKNGVQRDDRVKRAKVKLNLINNFKNVIEIYFSFYIEVIFQNSLLFSNEKTH